MTQPLLADIGYLAEKPSVSEILDGTYVPPPGVGQYTVDFFERYLCQMQPKQHSLFLLFRPWKIIKEVGLKLV